jgi:hypothetical protein
MINSKAAWADAKIVFAIICFLTGLLIVLVISN